jgi:hypothetical protein
VFYRQKNKIASEGGYQLAPVNYSISLLFLFFVVDNFSQLSLFLSIYVISFYTSIYVFFLLPFFLYYIELNKSRAGKVKNQPRIRLD